MTNILVGHSSFYVRMGWIKKGVEYVKKNSSENIFVKSNIAAIDELGIGSVMVQSLRYWMILLDILKKQNKEYCLKRDIELIIKKDPYFENKNSLWLLHSYIMDRENKEEKAVLWEIFIKSNKVSSFSDESAMQLLVMYCKENGIEISSRSAKDSLSVFLKTYNKDNKVNEDPEDGIYSPFTKLEYLIKNSDEKYYFRNIEHSEITEYLPLYLLTRKLKNVDTKVSTFNEAYIHFNSIIKMRFNDYEKLISKLERTDLISIDRAAGLQNIHIVKKLSETEIVEKILESEN
ncbi:DUF4007 family protein [Clostridium grantii]|uniref:DUF4007 domain-containing protein n=1 Tax=Clostridium grantii DSM 8605 TaxID=1121316 RepID=A0A1M5XYX8_9CLOT|nr:DUF4007 family protein [Clostridium grantii]SHI04483.1 Protein of unknown function [Clostridium grantii DSM 8605]